ncbi:MAG: ABC transporter, partial [Angustibacter sp.]
TTRAPILLHHPDDERWFATERILPKLARHRDNPAGAPRITSASDLLETLQLAPAKSLAPGLGLLDSPDIDSIEEANRDLAHQLLSAADLWVFVTTAARYADAIPWDLLRQAADRGACVAVVLDRVPPKAVKDIQTHLGSMLRERGLESSPLFTIAEQPLTDLGLLPPAATKPLRLWLRSLAKGEAARAQVVQRTLTGALQAMSERIESLAAATSEQHQARQILTDAAVGSFDAARLRISSGLTDGRLLRGEVMASWQDFVGSGELLRKVEARIGRWRDRFAQAARAQTAPTEQMGAALQSGVRALIAAELDAAEQATRQRWERAQGGAQLLELHPELQATLPDLPEEIDAVVTEWQDQLRQLVQAQGQDRRTAARVLAFGVNGTGVLLMLVTVGLSSGSSRSALSGGTAAIAHRLLVALFGGDAVRSLTTAAQQDLLARIDALLLADRSRFERAIDLLGPVADRTILDDIRPALEPGL